MNVTLYRRGRTYYVQVREGGQVVAHQSTRESNRKRAEKWVRENYSHFATQARKRANPTFREFTENFFAWDSTWSMDRRTSGKRHSERNSRERTRILELYLLPEFADRRLDEIATIDIKRFRDVLFARLSGARVHQILVSLRQILIAAEEAGYVDRLPRIPTVSTEPQKRTGVLTIDEASRLFREGTWKDLRARTACLLAASTGMRLGEIQALTWKDVDLARGIITVISDLCKCQFKY
ncbi:MAG: tyrosine-type recombinase/integrase [Spirochaetales bacterium]|nr:tyrosine-type recombinase/integrase [Spirochaetales bacterium]